MIDIRPFSSLGGDNHGWLNAKHHFSFANYYDPQRMGWGALRVWNDDQIAPQTGFPPHPHSNMEIITYVREGAITHKDNLGNHGRTEAGDVQVMSAGDGVQHSEYNLENTLTKIFQIWIMPDNDKIGGEPSWGSKPFPKTERFNEWITVASGRGNPEGLFIRANAEVVVANISPGHTLTYSLEDKRLGYMVAAQGMLEVNGHNVSERDGVAFDENIVIANTGNDPLEVIVVDVQR